VVASRLRGDFTGRLATFVPNFSNCSLLTVTGPVKA
jgi:hypothetical protein